MSLSNEVISGNEPMTPAQRRVSALRRAATAKREAATARAETAIRDLIKNQQEITFRSVARVGGVSLDFLYANTEIRRRIETLRAQQAAQPAPQPPTLSAENNLVHILTAKLREERAAHRAVLAELEQRVAATHGELLRLRRVLQQHEIKH
jgi:hypothetical protein